MGKGRGAHGWRCPGWFPVHLFLLRLQLWFLLPVRCIISLLQAQVQPQGIPLHLPDRQRPKDTTESKVEPELRFPFILLCWKAPWCSRALAGKFCTLQACYEVASPPSEAVGDELSPQRSQKWSRKVLCLPLWWREALGEGPWHSGVLCQDSSRIRRVPPSGRSPSTGLPQPTAPATPVQLHVGLWTPCRSCHPHLLSRNVPRPHGSVTHSKAVTQQSHSPGAQPVAWAQPRLPRLKPRHTAAQSTAHLPSAVPSPWVFTPGSSSWLGWFSFWYESGKRWCCRSGILPDLSHQPPPARFGMLLAPPVFHALGGKPRHNRLAPSEASRASGCQASACREGLLQAGITTGRLALPTSCKNF